MNKTNLTRKKELTAAAAIVFAGLAAYTVWTDLHVYVSRYSMSTDKVSGHLRIVQISDFHNDRLLGDKMLDKVRREEPDIIVITGDFIDRNRTDISYALDTAEALADIAPVYYVPGNHESAISSYSVLKNGLILRDVTVLDSSPVEISPDIHLYGINDPFFVLYDDSLSRSIIRESLSAAALDSSRFNMLLSHRPEAFEEYADSGFDLVFTGHAHGGQFRFPFIGGIFSPGQGLLPEYDAGEFRSGGTTMIVSRGVGNSIMPLRIGNPPEIVVVDINPH